MTLFNRLPGFTKTPPGQERVILRRLPEILSLGHAAAGNSVIGWPACFSRRALKREIATQIMTVDIYGISLIVLHWTVVFTVAIGAFIVVVMKGPAYVADPYPLEDAEHPDRPGRRQPMADTDLLRQSAPASPFPATAGHGWPGWAVWPPALPAACWPRACASSPKANGQAWATCC